MNHVTLIGWLAGALTTISFLPQVVKVWRTRHTRDLSLPMYLIFLVGLSLWTYYGVLTRSVPIIVANSVTLLCCIYIVVMKVRCG